MALYPVLFQTQHRLNTMLKECKQAALESGEGIGAEVETRELGTLKTKPGRRTKKRKAGWLALIKMLLVFFSI